MNGSQEPAGNTTGRLAEDQSTPVDQAASEGSQQASSQPEISQPATSQPEPSEQGSEPSPSFEEAGQRGVSLGFAASLIALVCLGGLLAVWWWSGRPEDRELIAEVLRLQHHGQHEELDAYLERYPAAVTARMGQWQRTALHLLAAGDPRTPPGVELLIQHGADVNATDLRGWTPLNDAVDRNHVEVVKLLLRHQGKPGVKIPAVYNPTIGKLLQEANIPLPEDAAIAE